MLTVLTLMFFLGALILFYPFVSNWINEKNQSQVAESYFAAVQKMNTADYTQEKAQAEAYNAYLKKNYDSLNAANLKETKVNMAAYEQLLNAEGNGVMGVLEIPAIDVYLPIYHGTSEEVLQTGIGHYTGSSLPVGGNSTHTVLTGHRGLPSAELLTDIDKIKKQDLFYIHALGETFAYEVDQITTVLPQELENMNIVDGQDYATLVTCTPYGINTHRLLIRGRRTAFTPTQTAQKLAAEQQNRQEKKQTDFWLAFSGVIFTVLLLGMGKIIQTKRRKLKVALK